MAHGHRQGRVGPLLGMQPQIGELGCLGIVGGDDGALRPLVADLRIEMRIGRPGLRHVGAPDQEITRIVPIGTFGNVRLLAPGHRAGGRQVAIPVIEGEADAAEKGQIARAGGVGHHGHGRNRREADHAIGPIGLHRIGVRRGDDLVDLVPCRADEPAQAALAGVARAPFGILDDRGPCGDRRQRRARLAPQLEQAPADHRVLHAVGRIEIPGVAGAPRAAAGLVVREIRPGSRVIGLLSLPGHDAALDVDLPGAGAGAVHAMGGAHDLVVLPALAITVLPVPRLVGDDPVAVGEGVDLLSEEGQSIEKVAHAYPLGSRPPAQPGCSVSGDRGGRSARLH